MSAQINEERTGRKREVIQILWNVVDLASYAVGHKQKYVHWLAISQMNFAHDKEVNIVWTALTLSLIY